LLVNRSLGQPIVGSTNCWVNQLLGQPIAGSTNAGLTNCWVNLLLVNRLLGLPIAGSTNCWVNQLLGQPISGSTDCWVNHLFNCWVNQLLGQPIAGSTIIFIYLKNSGIHQYFFSLIQLIEVNFCLASDTHHLLAALLLKGQWCMSQQCTYM